MSGSLVPAFAALRRGDSRMSNESEGKHGANIVAARAAKRPVGFMERNRGLPESKCAHSATLGKAGGFAHPPPRAREGELRQCLQEGNRRMAEAPVAGFR